MEIYSVCWSLEQRTKKQKLHYPEPQIVHMQNGNGRTKCGIEIGITWAYDFQEKHEINAPCKRCWKEWE